MPERDGPHRRRRPGAPHARAEQFPIHGYHRNARRFGALAFYGSDATEIQGLAEADPRMGEPLHPRLAITGAEVQWAARREMARSVDDVLARRTRALLFDAQAATEAAPRVAEILSRELGRDATWAQAQVEAFRAVASGYRIDG